MTTQERAIGRLTGREEEAEQQVTNLWLDAFRRLARNRAAILGLIVIVGIVFVAIFAPVVAPYGYRVGNSSEARTVPAWLTRVMPGNMADYATIGTKFPIGSDYLGRDLLSRIIYGTRVSLPVGFIGAMTALVIGLVYGCISGYYGGRVDNIMMRVVDIVYAFPTMLLIILLMAFFKTTFGAQLQPGTAAYSFNQINRVVDRVLGLDGGGMLFIFMGIGVTAWMGIARLARGQILSIKEKEFNEASRMIGARDLRIIVRHILPNIIGPILVSVTLSIPGFISTEVFLSFIGLGVDAPTPSWGSLISDGAQSLRAYPHEVFFPALALAITMFAFNFLGDGLRDALDPRMKGAQ
jgi:oligopeptide transport system permease protein